MTEPNDNPIIFLDMDGVISTRRAYTTQANRHLPDRWIDAEAMHNLNNVCELSGAPVVISSTWRLSRSRDEFAGILGRNGFSGQLHEDWRTDELWTPLGSIGLVACPIRGDEVAEWLSRHPEVSAYVCLDDDADFRPGQPLVLTEFERGLTAQNAELAISALRAIRHETTE